MVEHTTSQRPLPVLSAPPRPERPPRVSIGLPVYNGARYLEATLRSLLQQSFTDFELIISDNGSTDATERICREYAARDPRIRYLREDVNRGITWNFMRVLRASRGTYFKWSAHDDVCAPSLLEQCVRVLDSDPSVVLCTSEYEEIDYDDQPPPYTGHLLRAESDDVVHRLRETIHLWHFNQHFYGLCRRDVLARMQPLGGYWEEDRVMLAELCLHGRFHVIPERLWIHRLDIGAVVTDYNRRHEFAIVHDPSKRTRRVLLPAWYMVFGLVRAVHHAPLRWDQKLRCYLEVARVRRRKMLLDDLVMACRRVAVPSARRTWRQRVDSILGVSSTGGKLAREVSEPR